MHRKNQKIKCLLLTTQDQRKFFTQPDNLPQLVEFSKTFGAELSIVSVEAETLSLLDLSQLAPAICSPQYHQPEIENIEILQTWPVEEIKIGKEEKKLPRNRNKQIELAKQIRADVRSSLLRGSTVDLSNITRKYQRHNLKLCTISNHIRTVRDQLVEEGKNVQRTGVGQYKLMK